jgi:hypothetical protein
MALRRQKWAEPDDPRLVNVFFLVRATDFEQRTLWEKWGRRVNWQDDSQPVMGQIGTIGRRPVTLQINFARIDGKLVAFWQMPSPLKDSLMAEKWLVAHCPLTKRGDGPHAECDAVNFHLCLSATDPHLPKPPCRHERERVVQEGEPPWWNVRCMDCGAERTMTPEEAFAD